MRTKTYMTSAVYFYETEYNPNFTQPYYTTIINNFASNCGLDEMQKKLR